MSNHIAPDAIFAAASAGRLFRVTFSLGMTGWRSAICSSMIVVADDRASAVASVAGGRDCEGPLTHLSHRGEWVL